MQVLFYHWLWSLTFKWITTSLFHCFLPLFWEFLFFLLKCFSFLTKCLFSFFLMATVNLFSKVQLRGCAEDKTFPGLSSRPPTGNLIVLSQKNCDPYGSISGGVSDVASEVTTRSHGQVEPAVCGGQGQTLRQPRWEVWHSSVNREVLVIYSRRARC